MSGVRFDYRNERQRHEKFVGREALLARLDELLVSDGADRWVVITGGPGMGKSAILSAWLARREAAGAVVPHHFIRRGAYDWDDPAKLVGSLVAQIDERFPDACEPDADARMNPAARLARALLRVSDNELGPRGERLVVLIDGLDEYDPPAGALPGDPLAAFLPHALPRGVSFLCTSRPRHPYVSSLEARDGDFVQLDLDAPDSAADNDATVRTFWEGAAVPLGLDARFVNEAVARAGGNVQHAVQLRRQVAATPAQLRRIEDIPRGLGALIERTWERIAQDAVVVEGLGILCAAREALVLDELGAVAAWTADATRRAFLRGAKEVLVETQRPDGQREYRLHHDSIRAHIAQAIGDVALRGHHSALAQRLATWPTPDQAVARRYALRHTLMHRAEAGDWADAWRIASDTSFLEAKCREFGAHDVEADVTRVAERCRAAGNATIGDRFSDLARALVRESHWMRAAPEATAAVLWNRLRRSGWSEHDLSTQLRVPVEAAFLRVRHTATRESPALVRDLVGHSGGVCACVVTSDGRRVVSASDDKTLKVWDLESGRMLATLEGHAAGVRACAVTPDGRRVVSASDDKTLKVWDLESGRALAILEDHASEVCTCAVTPDGRRVVSASDDGTLKVWDLESGRALATLKSIAGEMRTWAVTPDGRRVVSALGGILEVWDLESGNFLHMMMMKGDLIKHGWVRRGTVTTDGRRAISISVDGMLQVWDLESRRALSTVQGHVGRVNACAVTPDGRRVISASDDKTLKVWDLESGHMLVVLEGHTDGVRTYAVTPDGRCVVSASADRTLKVWDLESGHALATLEGHAAGVIACVVTPDGRRVISASDDKTLKVWDLESGRARSSLECHADGVIACVVTPDGQRLVSASEDRTLKVWDLESGRALATLVGHAGPVRACAVTPDGRRVVSASQDRTLKVWDLESGRALATLVGHAGPVRTCAVTPDDRHVVSAMDETLEVWDQKSGHVLATLVGHAGWVRACAVTPDGRRVVSASDDQTLKVWDLESGRALATLVGHASVVNACAVTLDGQRAVSAAWDRTLKVWDLKNGRTLATLEGHVDWVNACAVTPDGRCVVSASDDKTLKVWDLATYACLFTHRGDAPYLAVAAGTASVVAGDSTGGICFLDWPPSDRRATQLGVGNRENRQHGLGPAQETPSPRSTMKKPTIHGVDASVDIGILTIREDEFRAVLDAFPQKVGTGVHTGASRQYILRHAEVATGERYTVAILRQVEQGTGEAQHAARDLMEDLAPKLVLVVGIAGGLPSDDVTLGDVVLGTRIHDYTVQVVKTGQEATYAATGGPIDQAIAAAVVALAGREDELGDWTSGLPPQPAVAWAEEGQIYGPPEWQRELRAKLEHHFGRGSSRRAPTYVSGPIASSDRLVKDPTVLFPWITTARNLLAVEMESGGVYRAARERCPMLAIRGISDIVGLKRADAWTKFACASAAAFARAFLRTRPVPVGTSLGAADPQ